jgi:hypothetical protein
MLILATWEGEIRRIMVQGSRPAQANVYKTPISKYPEQN